MASRSTLPVFRRSLPSTRNSWATSRWISLWIDSSVFFLWRKRNLIGWPHLTDLNVHFDEFLVQALKIAEGGDLIFCLTDGHRIGQRLSHALAFDLKSKPKIGTMPRIIRLMTMAGELAAFTLGGSNGSRAQIADAGPS